MKPKKVKSGRKKKAFKKKIVNYAVKAKAEAENEDRYERKEGHRGH